MWYYYIMNGNTTLEVQRVTIVGPNLPGSLQAKGTFHVHAEGCADLNRGAIRDFALEGETIEARSMVEVSDYIYDPDEFGCEPGENVDDFHFAPCVRIPFEVTS